MFTRDASFLCLAWPCLHGAEVTARGTFELKDDLTDVEKLSDDGYLMVRVWSLFIPRTVELRAERGRIVRRYYVAGLWRPYGEEARRLLATQLSSLVRRSGFAAQSRTARILATSGSSGVLAEIRQLDSGVVRGIYFRALFDTTHLDAPALVKVLALAGQLISSDFELSRTLQAAAPAAAGDAAVARAYLEAAERVSSDFEHRRALAALLRARPLDPAVPALVARSAARLQSDAEKGRLLRLLLHVAPRDVPETFLSAVRQIGSDFEKGLVLRQLLVTPDLPVATKMGVLEVVPSISSDFERSRVLRTMLAAGPLDPTLKTAFMGAADHLGSSFEQNRVLAALTRGQRR